MAEAPQGRRVRSRQAPRGRFSSPAWTAAASGAARRSIPEVGLLYVNANEMAWKVKLAERKMPDGEPTTGKALYETLLRVVPPADLSGTPPEFPRSSTSAARRSVDDLESIVRNGAGPMPGIPELHNAVRRAIVTYVATRDVDRGPRRRANALRLEVPLDGYIRFTDPDGFPAITPPWGTLTAIDMNRATIALADSARRVPGSGGQGLRTPAARTTAARS